MKKILILSALLATGGKVLGQGIESELYQYNYSFVHPAFAGSEGQKIAMLGTTATYNGSFGEYESAMVMMSYENYIDKIKSGLAVTGYSARIGPVSFSSLALSFNYKLKIGASSELTVGTRVQRHFHSVSFDFFRPIEQNDPITNPDNAASNWMADLGATLKVKEFYFGLIANNLLHSNNEVDFLNARNQFNQHYAAIIGGSFVLGENLSSQHSFYIPFDDAGYRIDLNNTLIIRDRFLAGLSIERSDDKFFVRGNAGVKVKDYFDVFFLVYSDKRNYPFEQKFRGELFVQFNF